MLPQRSRHRGSSEPANGFADGFELLSVPNRGAFALYSRGSLADSARVFVGVHGCAEREIGGAIR